MNTKDMKDVSQLREWAFQPTDINFGTLKSLERVRIGQLSSHRYRSRINTCLAASHVLSDVTLYQKEQIASTFVTYADLEAVDYNYMLCGLNDGGIAIYDVSSIQEGRIYSEVGLVKGGRHGGHKHAVECVQWYPADTGLFATCSQDKCIKIWDPNRMRPVDQFKFGCNVLHHHMSPVATKHSLLSASGETGEIILCDLRTGSSTHRIVAHEERVQITQWSPRNQHILVSGGKDQAVKMWDVRSAKACIMALDMNDNSTLEKKNAKKRLKKSPIAHRSRITSLCFTTDGLWLLTFSYDGDLKLWNSSTGENMNVFYGETHTDLKRPMRIAVSSYTHPDLVFVPSKSRIVTYNVLSGDMVNVLQGHFSTVYGVLFNPMSMNVYSYGGDRNFITWTPNKLLESELSDEEEEELPPVYPKQQPTRTRVTQDNWSSDED
ncbi:DNA excision repair protein ERCC-8-like [Palaemon carinicauda]|uniref:DNA excision repair protein ERCC-8-like n=1 Tax=Palaemon carinicauda TaxID=392227 RepID=UPI0035B589D2